MKYLDDKTSALHVELRPGVLAYIALARPDHWFKNVFMVPGIVFAYLFEGAHASVTWTSLLSLCVGIASTCLIASANYTINEWLDAEFDAHHPVKKNRPATIGLIKPGLAYLQYVLLSFCGLALAATLSSLFLTFACVFLLMGMAYNVRPVRTKDRAYLDVLSEAVNNPIRLVLGWAIVIPDVLPPSSLLMAYWMGGAFLMAMKRYAEHQFIGDHERAGLYRRSFQYYTEERLLISAFFYAVSSALFLGVFLIKYRVELLLSVPFFALLFSWYLSIGLKKISVAQTPEKLYRESGFVAYVFLLASIVVVLLVVDLPWLNVLVDTQVRGGM